MSLLPIRKTQKGLAKNWFESKKLNVVISKQYKISSSDSYAPSKIHTRHIDKRATQFWLSKWFIYEGFWWYITIRLFLIIFKISLKQNYLSKRKRKIESFIRWYLILSHIKWMLISQFHKLHDECASYDKKLKIVNNKFVSHI